MSDADLLDRIARIEDRLEIDQLPIRYALAVDARDVDSWLALFVPDVHVGREATGREALREVITPQLRWFYRSIHQIVGHRVELLGPDTARGHVYCRAEHEVGQQWVVMAIRYDDDYRKMDGQWLFSRRRERHWYAADVTDQPQSVAFDGWDIPSGPPNLPGSNPTWSSFWTGHDASGITDAPVH
ncbi:nuclear transport factor 2 family protein [Mycobacterium sp. URHB0044]|uniref:nuclear transport factor 2 family protein n=1 Tax=Mycobacterium sp. URHB0044 TaxID=1380386 RepID=UPI000AC251DB|nr:nuclear transport factor 2 family protein [Mycobacterium sp. URHB0044]